MYIQSYVQRVEAEACFAGHGGASAITYIFSNSEKQLQIGYAIIWSLR